MPVLLGGHLQPPQHRRRGLSTCSAWASALQCAPVMVPAPHHLPPFPPQEHFGQVSRVWGEWRLVWHSQLWSREPLGQCLASLTALLPACPSHWLQLPPLLTSSSVALRILAGETIALLFELAQDLEVTGGL